MIKSSATTNRLSITMTGLIIDYLFSSDQSALIYIYIYIYIYTYIYIYIYIEIDNHIALTVKQYSNYRTICHPGLGFRVNQNFQSLQLEMQHMTILGGKQIL